MGPFIEQPGDRYALHLSPSSCVSGKDLSVSSGTMFIGVSMR